MEETKKKNYFFHKHKTEKNFLNSSRKVYEFQVRANENKTEDSLVLCRQEQLFQFPHLFFFFRKCLGFLKNLDKFIFFTWDVKCVYNFILFIVLLLFIIIIIHVISAVFHSQKMKVIKDSERISEKNLEKKIDNDVNLEIKESNNEKIISQNVIILDPISTTTTSVVTTSTAMQTVKPTRTPTTEPTRTPTTGPTRIPTAAPARTLAPVASSTEEKQIKKVFNYFLYKPTCVSCHNEILLLEKILSRSTHYTVKWQIKIIKICTNLVQKSSQP